MKSTFPFLIFLLLLSICSCKRFDGETVVEGTVVERSSGKAVPNAKVIVYSRNSRALSGYNTKELEKQADSNGNFSFSFEGESEREYALRAKTDLGHFTESLESAKLKEGRNNKNLKLKVHSPAWVRVNLTNVPPKNEIPQFHIQGSFNDKITGTASITIDYIQKDTILIRGVIGNKENSFRYYIKESNGTENTQVVKKYFPALDTTDLVIEY